MSDRIKQFIQEHRNAFDQALPETQGWQNIEKMIDRLPATDPLERFLLLNRALLDTEMPDAALWQRIEGALPAGKDASIESYIDTNREALDTEIPDLKVWAGIEQSLPNSTKPLAKHISIGWQRRIMRVAAAVSLLITGMGLGLWYAHAGAQTAAGMAMSDVSNEYAELEQYYQRDIAGKTVKLASIGGSQQEEVHEDLEQLDDIMADLRKELAGVPPGNREQIVRAMIENYKAKAAILQRVLERLESSKTENTNSGKKHEVENI